MKTMDVKLKSARIPEWEAEDLLVGRLSSDSFAEEDEIKEILDQIHIGLPKDINYTELVQYSKAKDNPISLELPLDHEKFNFYFVEIPLNILVTENQRLVRLRLRLNLLTEAGNIDSAIAYDLFPPDKWEEKITSLGEFDIDLSKMLSFISKQPVDECMGLNLKFPIKWKSNYIQIRTTDRMSNPVEWYITDQQIDNGFTGYVVIRTPKNSSLNIVADIACELHKSGLFGKMFKARFKSDKKNYLIKVL